MQRASVGAIRVVRRVSRPLVVRVRHSNFTGRNLTRFAPATQSNWDEKFRHTFFRALVTSGPTRMRPEKGGTKREWQPSLRDENSPSTIMSATNRQSRAWQTPYTATLASTTGRTGRRSQFGPAACSEGVPSPLALLSPAPRRKASSGCRRRRGSTPSSMVPSSYATLCGREQAGAKRHNFSVSGGSGGEPDERRPKFTNRGRYCVGLWRKLRLKATCRVRMCRQS